MGWWHAGNDGSLQSAKTGLVWGDEAADIMDDAIAEMEHCARFVLERGIDVDKLFTNTWKLTDAAEAYRLAEQQTSGKGVFVP